MKEIIITGQYYRILVDEVNKIWHRLSYWKKASDIQFDDGTYLQDKTFGHCILARSTDYAVGDIAYCTNAPSWVRLRCVNAGKTALKEPSDYSTIQLPGVQIIDGTATFEADDIRPAENISSSPNQIPSLNLVDEIQRQAIKAAEQANNINIYVGEDGALHYTDKHGQDHLLDYDPHEGTYTFPAESVGETEDLGEIHNIKYINTATVYAKGYGDAMNQTYGDAIKIVSKYHHHTINSTNNDSSDQSACPYADSYKSSKPVGCFTKAERYQSGSHKVRCGSMNFVSGEGSCGGCWNTFRCSTCGWTTQSWSVADSNGSGWGMGDHYKDVADYSTRYVCNCGKTNGQILEQTVEYL